MSSGYNPYRKANGEFATKEEVGATVESDLAAARAAGDERRVREIEDFAMDKLDDTPLGQKILEEHYAKKNADRAWGQTNVSVGSRTPWGKADSATDIAPGITAVGTPGHGGVKLSKERNRKVPKELRTSSGWYEEDVEIYFVIHTFPEEFVKERQRKGLEASEKEFKGNAAMAIKNWYPDKWEAMTGETLAPGESSVKDEQVRREARKNSFTVDVANTAKSDPNYVVVRARRSADGASGDFLVSKAEYEKAGQKDFVVDPKRHPQLPPRESKKKEAPILLPSVPSDAEIDASPLMTDPAKRFLKKDLNQRWRSPDGTVKTLRETIETEGITSRTAYVNQGKLQYAILQKNASYRVSKATYKAFSDIPDQRSEATIASQEANLYYDRNIRDVRNPETSKLQRFDELSRRSTELYEKERAERERIHGTLAEQAQRETEREVARELAAKVEGA